MRFDTSFGRRLAATALFAGLVTAPAMAGDLSVDRVHADSFGNLVVYSAAGYKRIVVGRGYLAPEFARLHGAPAADAAYADDVPVFRPCRRPPAMFKGRSYMYGLPDNVVPVPGQGVCE